MVDVDEERQIILCTTQLLLNISIFVSLLLSKDMAGNIIFLKFISNYYIIHVQCCFTF